MAKKPTHEPGEYMRITWEGGQPDSEAVWGHVTPDEFWYAVADWTGDVSPEAFAALKAQFEDPTHDYMRQVRPENAAMRDYEMEYRFGYSAGPGASKVTVAHRRRPCNS